MSSGNRNTLVDQHYIAKQRLKCHPSTLRRMVKAGEFPEPIRFVENGFPRWTLGTVDDWFEAKAAQARAAAVKPKPPQRRGPKPGKGWRRGS